MSWATRECQDHLLAERGLTGFEPCGDASIRTPAEVKTACPLAMQMSIFTSPPPPPPPSFPLRCDVDLHVDARADFFCKGTGAERRVVMYLRDRLETPPRVGNELFEIFATQYHEHASGGGTLSNSRVVSTAENDSLVLYAVTLVAPTLPMTTVRRVFGFSSRTFTAGAAGGSPGLSGPRGAWFGLATHTAPR